MHLIPDMVNEDIVAYVNRYFTPDGYPNFREYSADYWDISGPPNHKKFFRTEIKDALVCKYISDSYKNKVKEYPEVDKDIGYIDTYNFISASIRIIPPGSGMKRHADNSPNNIPNPKLDVVSMVTYLNQTWDVDWGGANLYEEDDGDKFFFPKYKEVAVIRSPLLHTVAAVATGVTETRRALIVNFSRSVQCKE